MNTVLLTDEGIGFIVNVKLSRHERYKHFDSIRTIVVPLLI